MKARYPRCGGKSGGKLQVAGQFGSGQVTCPPAAVVSVAAGSNFVTAPGGGVAAGQPANGAQLLRLGELEAKE